MEYLRKVNINPGAEVSGNDFFNREDEFKLIKRKLKSTKHIVISQIRRTGKTSFMKEVINKNSELTIIYLAVQGCQNESEFYKEIYVQIVKQSTGKKIMGFLKKGWNTIAEMAPENPYTSLGKITDVNEEQIKNYLEHIFSKKEIILFIDEFPDFIINLKKQDTVESFLEKFRDFRYKCRNLHTVLTGSINLIRTVSNLGLSDKLNEYRNFEFPLFSPENSLLFFQCLLYSEDYILINETNEFIIPYLEDGMPYFIQLLADNVMDISPEKKELTIDNLKTAIERFNQFDEFGLEQFHDRLKTYLKEEKLEKPAKIILSHLSNDDLDFDDLFSFVDKEVTKERLAELLNRLEDEAYLKRVGEKYSFLSKLMAGWWKEKKHFDRR